MSASRPDRRRGAPPLGRVIAIDGPAGAGKSTAARHLARALGYRHIDTGAMYRAAAWAAVDARVPPDNADRVLPVLRRLRLAWDESPTRRLFANGRDITEAIRSPEVSQAASRLATVGAARRLLVAQQRRMSRGGGVVMEGRDIGTVVLPRANIKFFLDASAAERGRRRWKELRAKGPCPPLSEITQDIRRRDHRDRTRTVSPLRAAGDAVVIDTTRFSAAQVRRILLDWVRRKTGR